MSMDQKMYGFTSVKMKNLLGHQTVVWIRPDESAVEVDFVDKDPNAPTYKWDDKVCVGEVVTCIRPRKPGFAWMYGMSGVSR